MPSYKAPLRDMRFVLNEVLDIQRYAGLTIHDAVGSQYRIEYTDSLEPPVTWSSLTNLTLATSPYIHVDLTSGGAPKRFYRATPSSCP